MTNWITRMSAPGQEGTASGVVSSQHTADSVAEVGFKQINYAQINLKGKPDSEIKHRIYAMLSAVKAGDLVIVQFPMWLADTRFERFFIDELKFRQVKIVAMVWDILSWVRDDSERDYSKDYALEILNHFDLVIAANRKMAKRLREEGGVKRPILSMDLSDSRYQGPLQAKTDYKRLYFVGSRLNDHMVMDYTAKTPFYMIGQSANIQPTNPAVKLMGVKPAAQIPMLLEGGFGVVQYAKPVRFKGMQKYGEYNNPLKMSMYLSAGIPVIIGSKMAHADLVRKENLGLVLDDLNQIDAALAQVTPEQYASMLEAVWPWQQATASGFFAKRAALESVRVLTLGFTDSLAEQEEVL